MTPTLKAVFPEGRMWTGEVEGDGAEARFVVEDIVDGGVSEVGVTGRPIQMKVPVLDVVQAGGTISPLEQLD